jgi:hypothetical protein
MLYALDKHRQAARWRVGTVRGSELFDAAGRVFVAIPATRKGEAVWAAIDEASGRCDWVLALPDAELRCQGVAADRLLFRGRRQFVVVDARTGVVSAQIEAPPDDLQQSANLPRVAHVHVFAHGFVAMSRTFVDAARAYRSTLRYYRWP